MKLIDYKEDFIVHLTYEEEQILAEWVMDLMSKMWFDQRCGKLYRLVREIYRRKCETGTDYLASHFIELYDAVANWNEKYEVQIPLDFVFEENGRQRTAPLKTDGGKEYSREERIRWIRQDTRRAWREVWQRHPVKGTDDEFLVFPGDDPDVAYANVQVARERRFWDEVERRAKDWRDLSRTEVIRTVNDYMPRGDERMPDPNGDSPSLLDRLEVEYPDPE